MPSNARPVLVGSCGMSLLCAACCASLGLDVCVPGRGPGSHGGSNGYHRSLRAIIYSGYPGINQGRSYEDRRHIVRNKESYRGWTIITERCSVQTGRSCQVFWECRAYKGRTEGEVEEGEAETITPARSLDKEIAYREACARIDRIMGTQGRQDTGDRQGRRQGTTTQGELSVLAEEFGRKPKLLNLTYKVENERANHRREPRYRPQSRILSPG
jgi:hypothetical protein